MCGVVVCGGIVCIWTSGVWRDSVCMWTSGVGVIVWSSVCVSRSRVLVVSRNGAIPVGLSVEADFASAHCPCQYLHQRCHSCYPR